MAYLSLKEVRKALFECRAARIVINSPYRKSALPIISQLRWQTVNELIEKETVKMIYRSMNHEALEYLTGLFQRLSEPVLDSFVTPALTFMYLC